MVAASGRTDGSNPVVKVMKRRRLRAGDVERALSVVGMVGLVVALATLLVGTDGVASWWRIVLLPIGLVVVLWALQAWRWQIVLDEEGMTIAGGLRRPRRVPWDRFVGIHREPPASVEVRGDQDIRFDVSPGRMFAVASCANSTPQSPTTEGTDR